MQTVTIEEHATDDGKQAVAVYDSDSTMKSMTKIGAFPNKKPRLANTSQSLPRQYQLNRIYLNCDTENKSTALTPTNALQSRNQNAFAPVQRQESLRQRCIAFVESKIQSKEDIEMMEFQRRFGLTEAETYTHWKEMEQYLSHKSLQNAINAFIEVQLETNNNVDAHLLSQIFGIPLDRARSMEGVGVSVKNQRTDNRMLSGSVNKSIENTSEMDRKVKKLQYQVTQQYRSYQEHLSILQHSIGDLHKSLQKEKVNEIRGQIVSLLIQLSKTEQESGMRCYSDFCKQHPWIRDINAAIASDLRT